MGQNSASPQGRRRRAAAGTRLEVIEAEDLSAARPSRRVCAGRLLPGVGRPGSRRPGAHGLLDRTVFYRPLALRMDTGMVTCAAPPRRGAEGFPGLARPPEAETAGSPAGRGDRRSGRPAGVLGRLCAGRTPPGLRRAMDGALPALRGGQGHPALGRGDKPHKAPGSRRCQPIQPGTRTLARHVEERKKH